MVSILLNVVDCRAPTKNANLKLIATLNIKKLMNAELATLLKSASYLFDILRIQIYKLFNFNVEKCVLLAKDRM